MDDKLTPEQTLMMWSLLGQGGRAFQADVWPEPSPKDRNVMAKFLSLSKQGRSNVLEMTDPGWEWCARHLTDELPPNFQVLRDFLTKLDAHFKKSGAILPDFIGPPPELAPPQVGQPEGAVEKAKTKPKREPPLPKRIETAYLSVSGGEKDKRVLLKDVRTKLPKVRRADFDRAVLKMHTEGGAATLMGFDDPRQITSADRAAQISFKGEDFYILWISR